MLIHLRIAAALIATSVAMPCAAGAGAAAVADFNTCSKPVYPPESLRHEQQGTVTLAFLIGVNGEVRQSNIAKSSGFPLLDIAAQQAVEKCLFKPGTRDGQTTESWAKVQFVWTLKGKKPDNIAFLKDVIASAERGEADGQYKLGAYYWHSPNPDRDPALGESWLHKAADQGHREAQYALGMIRTRIVERKVNVEEAEVWFRKAADNGHADAQYMIGMMQLEGQGLAKNETEAMQWLRKAAAQGSARALTGLAKVLMQEGQSDENVAEALALLAQAEKLRDRRALYMLGHLHTKGRGVERDITKAADYFKEAAAMGHVPAQLSLAQLYERGEGVVADPAKAKLLRSAAAQPNKQGK